MMPFNYDHRVFRSVTNSAGGDVSHETSFRYRQDGIVVWATYSGGLVRFGTLLGTVADDGSMEIRYQHLTTDGAFRSGRCHSRPELLPDGCLRLHETWTWTDGGEGSGVSIIEEVAGQ
jgi:hypothetical protein